MSDFEIAGINSLKQALTLMGKQPKAMGRRDPIAERLIDEIYVELRQARIAGYTWKDLATAINDKCKMKLSPYTVTNLFCELDLKYEKETGIKALPVAKGHVIRKKTKLPTVSNEAKDVEDSPVCTYTGKKRGRPKKDAA